ncbi:hypothetical protein [Paenibacillus ferrarius]
MILTHIEQSGMHALEAESGQQAIERLESDQVCAHSGSYDG